MHEQIKRLNLLLASLRYFQAAAIRAQENSGQPDDFAITPVFKEEIAGILRDSLDYQNQITFSDVKNLIDELCVKINTESNIVWIEVDGGIVHTVHGPSHLEVRVIDNDNGESDEVTAKENEEEMALLEKAKAAGQVTEIF